jgi:site-specific DNA recombinase
VRAVGYFRETGRASLAEQSDAFLEFCRSNGYEAAATFLDHSDESEGAGFRQLIEFARQQAGRGFMVVVVASVETLGPSPTEAIRRYFELSTLGLPVAVMDEDGDPSERLLAIWTKHRANGSLGERVKAAMRRKAVKGEALGRPPYGYRVGPKRRLVIVPEEGSVVRYIYRLYLKDGLGIRRIARRLNEENLRTRRNGLWSMVTVRDILRNRAYVGTYSRFGVRVPASHPPLISQEDFQRVQERLDQRRPASRSRRMSPFLLSGLIYCGYCGNKMIGVTRKQKWQRRGDGVVRTAQYRYYQCESRTNRSLCDYHTRRAEEMEEEVREALLSRRLSSSKHGADGRLSPADAEAQIKRLRNKARRLDRRLEQYLDSAVAGKINAERLRSLALAIAAEQLEVEERLVESQHLIRLQANEAERKREREEVLRRLRNEWESLTFLDKQELLRRLLDRIIVRDEGIELVPRA